MSTDPEFIDATLFYASVIYSFYLCVSSGFFRQFNYYVTISILETFSVSAAV